MSKKVEFKLNLSGLNELMKSGPMISAVQQAAGTIAGAASDMSGEEYEVTSKVLNWVAVANVYPKGAAANRENLRHNTLEKALGVSGLPRTK